jgi:superfamily II DNA or RNA helicase
MIPKKYTELQPYTSSKRKGYVIEKANIKPNILSCIKSDLTLEPKVHKDYARGATKIPIYFESKKLIIVPPYWALENIGKAHKNFIKDGKPFSSELKTIFPPKKEQIPVIDKTLKQLKKIKGAFITVGCGFGKTFISIYLSTLLKQKTLIIVHTSVLLEQWIERLNDFVPEAKIGKIKGKVFDVEGNDFVIAMLQTIVRKDRGYNSKTFKDFGVTIFDECFRYDTGVITQNGYTLIGTLYEMWKNKQDLPLILSYNKITQSFEYKKMTYAWRKERKDMVKIIASKKIIRCTPEHKILTNKGYVKANKLKEGDLLMSYNNYNVNNKFLTYTRVNKVEEFIHNGFGRQTKPYVYDIEVEDNHNFIVCGNKENYNINQGIIVSNCHHMGAPYFSSALPIVSTKYKIGLSATPERNDKLENIFYWWVGPHSFYDRKREGIYTLVKIVRYYEESFVEKKMWTGGYDLVKMVENIITNEHRNRFIIKQLNYYTKLGRQTIVLSTRRSHLEVLKAIFEEKQLIKNNGEVATCGMYVGGMKSTDDNSLNSWKISRLNELIEANINKVADKYKKFIFDKKTGERRMKNGKIKIFGTKKQKIELIEESGIEYELDAMVSLEESAKSDVLFATYQLVSEGTDIPTLNTLIMASPKKEVEQVVGRIQRAKNAHKPLVLDICDMFSVYINQGKTREKFYKKQDYHVDEIEYDVQDSTEIPMILDQEDKKCNTILEAIKKKKRKKEKEKLDMNELNECLICLSD